MQVQGWNFYRMKNNAIPVLWCSGTYTSHTTSGDSIKGAQKPGLSALLLSKWRSSNLISSSTQQLFKRNPQTPPSSLIFLIYVFELLNYTYERLFIIWPLTYPLCLTMNVIHPDVLKRTFVISCIFPLSWVPVGCIGFKRTIKNCMLVLIDHYYYHFLFFNEIHGREKKRLY